MYWLWDALIGAGAPIAYLATGWQLAVRHLDRAWEAARDSWYSPRDIRAVVKERFLFMCFLWPLWLFSQLGLMFSRRVDAVIDRGDPVRLAEQAAERNARIAVLERELGTSQW